MIKLAGFFWLVLVATTGFAVFAVKYEVQSLADDLNRARKETAAEEHAIRMDAVEWAYLTRPEILEEMNRRHLSLTPIGTTQLRATLPDIPLRPPPPPPIEDAVAAVTPPTAVPPAPETAPTPERSQLAAPAGTAAPALASSNMAAPPLALAQTAPTMANPVQIPTRAPEVAKLVVVKAATKPAGPRRAKTLDDLIAQIVASR